MSTLLTGNEAIDILKQKIGRKSREDINKSLVKYERKKREKINNMKETDQFIIILTQYMKRQNYNLLMKIAKYKNLSKQETNLLIEKYWKINYYTPNITSRG